MESEEKFKILMEKAAEKIEVGFRELELFKEKVRKGWMDCAVEISKSY